MADNHKRVILGDLCQFISGNGFRPSDWESSGLPIIRIQNLNGSRSFNYFDGEPEDKWIVEPGDLLFAWAGVKGVSFGPKIWPGPRGVLNQHIYRVVVKPRVDRYWMCLALQMATSRIESRAHGFKSSLVHVHKDDIVNQVIDLPPLSEQRKIAEILRTWDEAIEKLEALRAAKERQKRGLMQSLFTGKHRLPEFEGQPWREVRLGEVAEVDRQSLGSETEPDFEFEYISLSNVEPGRIVGPLEKLRFADAPSRAQRIVEEGDILVSTVRPNLLGFARVGIDHQQCIASTGFAVVSSKKSVDGSYLFHFLFSNDIKAQFHALVVGSNYPAINSSDVKKLRILVPSLSEQQKLAELFDTADREISLLEADVDDLTHQKRGLMQKLLTGEWRVRRPADLSSDDRI